MPSIHQEQESAERTDNTLDENTELLSRRELIVNRVEAYIAFTRDMLRAAGSDESEVLLRSAQTMKLEEKEILQWEEFAQSMDSMEASAVALRASFSSMLLRATHDGLLNAQQEQEWWERFENPQYTYKQRESFLKTIFPEWMKNWEKNIVKARHLRSICAHLSPPLAKTDTKKLEPHLFKELPYEERKKLCEQIEEKLASHGAQLVVDEEKKEEAFLEQRSIEKDISLGDIPLAKAKLVTQKSLDEATVVYLEKKIYEAKQQKEQEKKEKNNSENVQNSLPITEQKMLGLLYQIPHSGMREMYRQCMYNGPEELGTLASLFFNRTYAMEHGYTTKDKEFTHAKNEALKRQTEERMHDGHEEGHEENVLQGTTEKSTAIRDICTNAQVLYTSTENVSPVLEAVTRNTKMKNGGFAYFTSLVCTDIPYDTVASIVHTVHAPLLEATKEYFNVRSSQQEISL